MNKKRNPVKDIENCSKGNKDINHKIETKKRLPQTRTIGLALRHLSSHLVFWDYSQRGTTRR